MIPSAARQQVHARASDIAVSSFGSGLSSGKWQEGPEGLFSAQGPETGPCLLVVALLLFNACPFTCLARGNKSHKNVVAFCLCCFCIKIYNLLNKAALRSQS